MRKIPCILEPEGTVPEVLLKGVKNMKVWSVIICVEQVLIIVSDALQMVLSVLSSMPWPQGAFPFDFKGWLMHLPLAASHRICHIFKKSSIMLYSAHRVDLCLYVFTLLHSWNHFCSFPWAAPFPARPGCGTPAGPSPGYPVCSIVWGYEVKKWWEDGYLAEVTGSVSWRKLLTAVSQIELLICPSRCCDGGSCFRGTLQRWGSEWICWRIQLACKY